MPPSEVLTKQPERIRLQSARSMPPLAPAAPLRAMNKPRPMWHGESRNVTAPYTS